MAEPQKDTIYIDIDDEITAIIDKLQASSSKVVALVLPKRATTLQSVVNMKLLKRAGEQTGKNLVLVTTESSLMPLAGSVGLHVAATPNSRPEIPNAPAAANDAEEQVDELDLDDEVAPPVSARTAGATAVGDLAGASTMPLPKKPASDSGVETLELDNTDDVVAAAPAAAKAKAAKPKKDKKLQVPNFNRFRLILILGLLLILVLGVGGYFAFAVLPKASIAVQTNASNVNADVNFTLSTTAKSFTDGSKIVPAKQVTTQKTLTGTAPATGQKNNGEKASGTVTISAGSCSANVPSNLPTGSALTAGGKTYITQSSTTFTPTISRNKCTYNSADPTDIKAQSGGASFNTDAGTSFTIPGRTDLSATGSADGGTDDIQTVVSQSDIDTAKGKISSTSDNSAQDDLKSQLDDQSLYAITSTYNAGTPTTTTSADVGDEASNVTVTQVITYTMLGASMSNIKTLVDNDIKGQINTSSQSILNEGITQAAFKVVATTASGASMNIQTTGIVGPDLSTATIAQQAAGKKAGDIKSTVSGYTGVTDVQVKLSPFWVSKAPKNTSKITVTIAKPTNTTTND